MRPTPCPDGLAPCLAAGEYADLLRAMVLAHKERGTFSLARPLGRVLAGVAAEALPGDRLDACSSRCPRDARSSVPAATTRCCGSPARPRGCCGPAHPVVVRRLLAARAHVADQAGLTASERAANLAGSMAVRAGRARAARAPRRTPSRWWSCDDVLTTGATAREAQRALEDAGLRVRAVVAVAATRRRLPPRDCTTTRWPLPISDVSD